MVEWKKLGEVCETITPPKKLEKELYGVNGAFPIIDQGQKDIVGYTNDETSLVPNDEYILFGDHTRYVKYFNGSFAQGADGLKILKAANGILPRYFFFSFENVDVPSRGYSRHWSIAKELIIPIPSLEEQTRIVGILDTFTSAIDNLKEQIVQRRKQYEYYRDQLLDLEGKPGVEWFELLELCDYVDYRGKTPSKVDAGIFLVTAKNIRKGYIDYDNSKEYISEDDYEEVMHRGKPQIGDVLVTTEAPLGNVAQIDNENIALAQRVIKYRPKDERLNSSYLKYILLGSEFQIRLEKEATGATAKGIKGSKLHRMHIPLPPLSEQQRIVSILDTFEASIQNLEAQLEQREKQYEYYRNQLLTFERENEKVS